MNKEIRGKLDFAFDWCKSGTFFNCRPLSDVREFLENRNVAMFEEQSANLEVVQHDAGAFLRRRSSSEKGLPIRQTFFDKLMRWHQFPLQTLYRMEPDELLPLINASLRLINKNVVIHVEDGDALTIVSKNYARIADDQLLDRVGSSDIEQVTRTDHFIRITCREIKQVTVKPGDLVGIGTSVVNSETGFRALTVGWYLFRLVCSNGAIAPLSLYSNRIYHQKTDDFDSQLDTALNQLNRATADSGEIFRLLTDAISKPLPPRRDVERMLVPLLGFADTRNLIDPSYVKKTDRLYDLFNAVTWNAKRQPPSIQLAMEEYAGNMLWSAVR